MTRVSHALRHFSRSWKSFRRQTGPALTEVSPQLKGIAAVVILPVASLAECKIRPRHDLVGEIASTTTSVASTVDH